MKALNTNIDGIPTVSLADYTTVENSFTYMSHGALIFRMERSEVGQAMSFKLPIRILASKLRVGLEEASG